MTTEKEDKIAAILKKYKKRRRLEMRQKQVKNSQVEEFQSESNTPTTSPSMESRLILGDCIEVLKQFPDNHFTAVVTDPPYGLSNQPDMRDVLQHWLSGDDYQHRGGGFMGKEWDSFVPGPKIWEEVFRVLKPGGHVLSFSGTRTYDLMTTAMRLAALEVRDKIDFYCELERQFSWVYGSGFPKSHNISKAIDKAARGFPQGTNKHDPENPNAGKYKTQATEGKRDSSDKGQHFGAGPGQFMREPGTKHKYVVTDQDAKKWEGYGTALKPAHEPIADFAKNGKPLESDVPFHYTAKTSRRERNMGCQDLYWKMVDKQLESVEKDEYDKLMAENEKNKDKKEWKPHRLSQGNIWPTVKPIELIRYLVRLVKMPGENFILDPFMGSGTTPVACVLEGCGCVGIDRDPVAFRIAEARMAYFQQKVD